MKVKSVTTYTANLNDEEQSFKNSYIEYNLHGSVLVAAEWTGTHELESKTVSIYNAENKIIEETNYAYDDEISEHAVFYRNNDGSIAKVEIEYADGTVLHKIFSYNSAENTRTILLSNEDGEDEGKEFYKFDNNKNIIEKIMHNFAGDLEEHKKFIYDNDKIIQEEQFDKAGFLISTRRYSYDLTGNLIELIATNCKNIIIEKVKTKYDEKNRIVEQIAKDSYLIRITYDDAAHTRVEERFNQLNQMIYYLKTYENEQGLITEEETHTLHITYKYEFFDEA